MNALCPACEKPRHVRLVADPPLLAECQECGLIYEVEIVVARQQQVRPVTDTG